MQYKIAAHPTRYKDVLFRSRLEARWAAFFDLLEWKWKYEPVDFEDWSPDFELTILVAENDDANKVYTFDFYAEVKPYRTLAEFAWHPAASPEAIGETGGAPWKYGLPTALLGQDWRVAGDVSGAIMSDAIRAWTRFLRKECARRDAGKPHCNPAPEMVEPATERLWVRAGNATQWRPR